MDEKAARSLPAHKATLPAAMNPPMHVYKFRRIAAMPGTGACFRRLGSALACLGAAGLIVLAGAPLRAHTTNLAQSLIEIDGREVEYTLTVSPHDLAAALGIETDFVKPVPRAAFEEREELLAAYLQRRLRLRVEEGACSLKPFVTEYRNLPEEIVLPLRYRCPGNAEALDLTYRLFFDVDPTHRGFGWFMTAAGSQEMFFDRTMTQFRAAADDPGGDPAPWRRYGRLLVMGTEHILLGFDHLLFLLALIIVSARFWNLLKIVTAFTIAHSLTLALAWFGIIELPSRLVESLIAFSIAYVALENLLKRSHTRRWLAGFGFGLFHGLGFYSILQGYEIAKGAALSTLLFFNLGVELGQLAALAACFPLLWWGSRAAWYAPAQKWASAAILVVAGYWFVQRAFLA